MAEKSYRIRTEVGRDTVIKASLTQDIEFLEILSLKINQEDAYKLHVSNYGIIVGRVLGNEAFGIPNARVSVFIKLTDEDKERTDIVNLYPYRTILTKDKENRRYNLLPNESNNDCHRIVGTFPNKRLILDNDTEIEIYEKYWKYTTITNQSGDFMIFGVPTGNHTVHVDIDLSDIGILSQKPRDFFYKGYNKEQFESSEQFKEGTDLDNLTQLLSQNSVVYVYPFFGDSDINDIAISRCDIQIPYKFEPTCVFFGSIISDKHGQYIGHECGPTRWIGYNRDMVTGNGTIEMIRKTPDGLVEEFPIQGNHLIDSDGVWCYQIPMNLDYIGTDEFGNIVPVQDSTKGIPTRTSVRFRVSMIETVTQTSTQHVAKYLVPNIHELYAQSNQPQIIQGKGYDKCYEFGSATPNEYFRDLLWNKVYSVKNYIPRFEHRNWFERVFATGEKGYSGIRSVSSNHDNNIFPFNNARFHLKFTYQVLCSLMVILVNLLSFYNKLVSEIICWELKFSFDIFGSTINLNFGQPLKWLSSVVKCIGMEGSMFFAEQSDKIYFPSCDKNCGKIMNTKGLTVVKDKEELVDLIQQTLALEYEIVNLDFYNDWINGTLYMPLWFWKKRAKKKYFFGLFTKGAVNTFCSCNKNVENFSLTQPCSTTYDSNFMPLDASTNNDERHYDFDKRELKFGVIKEFTNRANLNVYYYAPGIPNDLNYKEKEGFTNYTQLFATDIILLGSLNSCDLDNLPKTFDSLPSTTVNVPFIATLNGSESGDGVVTGLDWGHKGYTSNGLLMDLSCWSIATQYKSCVNLSRLSELYVTFDMDISSDDDSEETIIHDGVINNQEIVENETRAKFASLNHNGLSNLVKNSTTNYDTYKFHYIYPINFDGHLNNLSTISEGGKVQTIVDNRDSNYVMYRLGEGKDSLKYGRHRKHFYEGVETRFQFPLFNNSFYFYFGLKEGKTAIDKFNNMFNASCSKRDKYGFTVDYVAKPGKWCYNKENIRTDFGTIDVEFGGLTDTFSYRLYNEFNELLITEENIQSQDLRFGYKIKSSGGGYEVTNGDYVKDGRLCYFNSGQLVKNSLNEEIFLENGVYYLEVINAFGLKVTQRINMVQNTLMPIVEEIKLGTKFNSDTERVDICGDMNYFGEIRIKSFIIDGEEVYITDLEKYFNEGDVNNEPDEVTCKVTCTDGSNVYLMLSSENNDAQKISNFTCYGEGGIETVRLEILGENIYTLIFTIWKPGDYKIVSNQLCNNIMNDNVSINKVSIENGEKFQAFLNDVPLNIIYGDNFKMNQNLDSSFPLAWLQLENPQNYNFFPTLSSNSTQWDDFLDVEVVKTVNENGVACEYISNFSKINILKLQLETIAKMRDMAYIYGDNEKPQIILTTNGGKEPILIRNIHPNYAMLDEKNNICDEVIIENNNVLEANVNFPHIIDKYYVFNTQENNVVRLNDVIYPSLTKNKELGNYFALFSNNGGMVSLQNGNVDSAQIEYYDAIPLSANPLMGYSTTKTLTSKQYPSQIKDGYFRSLFMDKRITMDSELWSPVYCPYNVYENDEGDWKDGRWAIQLHNVASMSYDENYNIIGDNLSYSIRKKSNKEQKILLNRNVNGNTYMMSGKFKDYDMGVLSVIAADEPQAINMLLVEFLKIYDDSVIDVQIKNHNDNNWEVLYYDLENITSLEELNEDIDVKLISHLKWNDNINDEREYKNNSLNNAKLYKCTMNIDGNDYDMRDSFKTIVYGVEKDVNQNYVPKLSYARTRDVNGLIVKYGYALSLDVANVKMKGDLEQHVVYEDINNNNSEINFISHVEGSEDVSFKYDISDRVHVENAAFSYGVENSGDYIVWDGQKIYLIDKIQKNEEKYYIFATNMNDFITNTNVTYEMEKNGTIINDCITIDEKNTSGTLPITIFDNISGYFKVKRMAYPGKVKVFESNVQEILNKYGIPYESTLLSDRLCYKVEINNKMYYGHVSLTDFSPLTEGSGFKNKNDGDKFCDYYYAKPSNPDDFVKNYKLILTKDEVLGNTAMQSIKEKNGYFYPLSSETNNKIIYLPSLITLHFNNNNTEITSYSYEQTVNYKVSQSSTNMYDTTPYLVVFYYLETTKSLFYDKKYEFAYGSLTDGETKIIDGDTYIFEQNGINGRWYYRNVAKSDYHELKFLYIIYRGLSQWAINDTYEFYYSGDNLSGPLDIKITNKVSPYDNSTTLSIKEEKIVEKITDETDENYKANQEVFEKISKIPLIQKQGTVKCWVDLPHTYSINANDGLLVVDEKNSYDIYNSSYHKFVIKDIEDFACTIIKDELNEGDSNIEANAPFLSCGIVKEYGLPIITQTLTSTLDSNTQNVDKWVKGNELAQKNIRTIKNDMMQCHFCVSQKYALFNNQYHSSLKLIPKHNEKDEMLDKNNDVISTTNDKLYFYKVDHFAFISGKTVTAQTTNFSELNNKWYNAVIWYKILSGTNWLISNDFVYVFAPGTYKFLSETNVIFTPLSESFTIDKETNITYGDLQTRAQNLYKQIEWVEINEDLKLFNEYFGTNRGEIEIYGNRSILNKNKNITTKVLNLEKVGNEYFYQGITNIKNIIQENKQPSITYLSNTNLYRVCPTLFDVTDEWGVFDYENIDVKYRLQTPIIGEIYPYINRYVVGTKQNDIFNFTNNNNHFLGRGHIGQEYGDYTSLPLNHFFIKDCYGFADDTNVETSLLPTTPMKKEKLGIGVIQSKIYDFNTPNEGNDVYENTDEYYDNLLYVYQPNTRVNIIKGTEIITCNYVKNYSDLNEDYRLKNTTVFAQSCVANVAPIYVGNVLSYKDEDNQTNNYLPLYFPHSVNQDIQNNIQSLKVYFNGEETSIVQKKNNSLININGEFVEIYNNIQCAKKDKIGSIKQPDAILKKIREGYYGDLGSIDDNRNRYFVDLRGEKIEYDREYDGFVTKLGIYKTTDDKSVEEYEPTFSIRCRFGVIRSNYPNGEATKFYSKIEGGELKGFEIYTQKPSTNVFWGVLKSKDNIKDAFIHVKGKGSMFKYDFSNITNINNSGYTLVNYTNSYGYIEHKDVMYQVRDSKAMCGGVEFEVKSDEGGKTVELRYVTISMRKNGSTSKISEKRIFFVNQYDKVIFDNGVEYSMVGNYLKIPYIQPTTWEENLYNMHYYFIYPNENGEYEITLANGWKKIVTKNTYGNYNCTYHYIRKYDSFSSKDYHYVEVEKEESDYAIINFKGKSYKGVKKYQGYSTFIFEIDGEEFGLYRNSGTQMSAWLTSNSISQETVNVQEFKNVNEENKRMGFEPFSNVWKINRGIIQKFNDEVLIDLEQKFNSNTSVEDFFIEIVQNMWDDYCINNGLSSSTVTVENIENIFHQCAKINSDEDYMSNNYFLTCRSNRLFFSRFNALIGKREIFIADEENKYIIVDEKSYRILKSDGDYYIDIYNNALKDYERYYLSDYFIIDDIKYNNKENDENNIKVCLYNYYDSDDYSNNNSLMIYENFNIQDFLDNVRLSYYGDKNDKVYEIVDGVTDYIMQEDFKRKLSESSQASPLTVYDKRLSKMLVKVESVNIEERYIEYSNPFNVFNVGGELFKYQTFSTTDDSLGNGYNRDGLGFSFMHYDINNVRVGDIIVIECGIVVLSSQDMIEIQCVDGYNFVGLISEKLTVINANGEKNSYTYGELRDNGVLGQKLYHLENIDGVYYEFISQIKDMREINFEYFIKIPLKISEKKYSLSLEVNDIIHKIYYDYDSINNRLKPL